MSTEETQETIYRRPSFWRKGNRINSENDSLIINIGIDDENFVKKSKFRSHHGKGANRVKSTKYTLLTFLPLNLFEQFRRIANFYFLCLSIIAVSIDSPVSPMTSIVPLIFVISVTAAKQGYENILKYRADNMVNKSLVIVIRNGIEKEIKCEDIQQGDLVKVSRNCDVPCDLVLIKSSESSEKCFITTANLDGETNLKTLLVPKGLPPVETDKLHTLGSIECEPSKTDLYSFNGRIDLSAAFHRVSQLPNPEDQLTLSSSVPLMAENVMLRGARVKNTEWAIGCAIYIGTQTKLALNSKLTRSKMTSSEKIINKYLVFFLVILIFAVTVAYTLKVYYDRFRAEKHDYLFIQRSTKRDRVGSFFQDYFSYLILFNYIIPISLYVTIEMHKFIGSLFMEWDIHLYDEDTDQPCIVNTSDLNEELGQVNILFSDKTGTLTKNEMVFQQCSINGKKYLQKGRGLQEEGRTYSLKVGECSKNVYTFFEALAICHTVQVGGKYLEDEDKDEDEVDLSIDRSNIPSIFSKEIQLPIDSIKEEVAETNNGIELSKLSDIEENTAMIPPKATSLDNATIKDIDPLQNSQERPFSLNAIPTGKHVEFVRNLSEEHAELRSIVTDSNGQQKPKPAVPPKPPRYSKMLSSRSRSSTREFYAAPVYTPASLLERNESLMRRKEIESFIEKLGYQSSSPDEIALVEACARLGLIYLTDNNDILTMRVRIKRRKLKGAENGEIEELVHFKRLSVLEFTSDRKRMSVIVMDKDGQIWLYTKGAESHVLPLCRTRSDDLIQKTQNHINDFARDGLRTLAVARKKLTKVEFLNFSNDLIEANSSLTDRAEKVEIVQSKIEMGLELLGATAVEDALQDNINDTLESIRKAGIKIWVLTGDKVETALNIAHSCGHIPPNAKKYFITECTDAANMQEHLNLVQNEIKSRPAEPFALLIDGSSLAIALEHTSEQFRDTTINCHAVLCCRLSPLQKCEVVHLMKTVKGKLITAAIGDGANDVSMIQEAHVGLGIVGKEGRQAARCSDYAFAKFCMLKRILLLHGHYFSQRLSLLILYFFYKNLVFMGIQFFFQIDSLFSTQSVYDSLFLTLYNVIYTAFPILFISVTEKIHPEEKLLSSPHLYQSITGNKLFAWRHFIFWITMGVFHSSIIYSFGSLVWHNNPALLGTGKTLCLYSFGTYMMKCIVYVVNLKLLIETVYKSYLYIVIIALSIFSFMLTTFIYNLFSLNAGHMLMVYNNMMLSLPFWALSTLTIVTALTPDALIKVIKEFNFNFKSIFPGNREMGTLRENHGRPREITSL